MEKEWTRISKEVHTIFCIGIGSSSPHPNRQTFTCHTAIKVSKREKEEAITDVLAERGAREACV
jgi:hypothetical protein